LFKPIFGLKQNTSQIAGSKEWQLEKLVDLGLEATAIRRGAFSNVPQAVKIRGELDGLNAARHIAPVLVLEKLIMQRFISRYPTY
jgi:hypothetical protein